MLTDTERKWVRELLCMQDGPNPKRITPDVLDVYAQKSEDDVRADIITYKAKKRDAINVRLAQLNTLIVTLQTQLNELDRG